MCFSYKYILEFFIAISVLFYMFSNAYYYWSVNFSLFFTYLEKGLDLMIGFDLLKVCIMVALSHYVWSFPLSVSIGKEQAKMAIY